MEGVGSRRPAGGRPEGCWSEPDQQLGVINVIKKRIRAHTSMGSTTPTQLEPGGGGLLPPDHEQHLQLASIQAQGEIGRHWRRPRRPQASDLLSCCPGQSGTVRSESWYSDSHAGVDDLPPKGRPFGLSGTARA